MSLQGVGQENSELLRVHGDLSSRYPELPTPTPTQTKTYAHSHREREREIILAQAVSGSRRGGGIRPRGTLPSSSLLFLASATATPQPGRLTPALPSSA